ncbi:hypothetical protein PIB30_105274 [Stylosanthes scabra]|uniref:Uncharacterized protein n=1 Tax=Stylosanthes scabra TaxID=79078 RepID=A0ABU6VYD5_9FABA|nr:hypothetical protein [Stylosanthes scabra]
MNRLPRLSMIDLPKRGLESHSNKEDNSMKMLMHQPAVKKPIFIDLTKDSESEGRSKEENPERKLAVTLRKMIGLRELDSDDSNLGFPYSTSSSLEEDDVLGNDPGFWDYDDLDDWGTTEPAASSEASCTSHPPPNH